MQRFHDQLVALMERREISQADLARRMDRPESYVSKILRGESNLTPPTMERIASAMGVEFSIHLVDPADTSTGSAELSHGESSSGAGSTPEPSTSKPLTLSKEAEAKAVAVLEELPPEVLAHLIRLAPKSENSAGRPPGPHYDYTQHLLLMGIYLLTGEAKSEREAARLVRQWAKENGKLRPSSSTLRRHFRQQREVFLERARFQLARKRRAAAADEAPQSHRSERVRQRASGDGAAGAGRTGGAGRPLSSYDSVTRELSRLYEEFRFPIEALEALRTPYVLEEVQRLAATANAAWINFEAVRSLEREYLAAVPSIPPEITVAINQLESAIREKRVAALAAANLLPESARVQFARHLDATRDLARRIPDLQEELRMSGFFRDLY